jgi:hypothetical protein
MPWSTDIHVRSNDPAAIAALLADTGEECYVATSGPGWVGVFSRRAEESGGAEAPRLAALLATACKTWAIGILTTPDAVYYWLYHGRREVDRHPPRRRLLPLRRQRPLLRLAPNLPAGEQLRQFLAEPAAAEAALRLTDGLGLVHAGIVYSDFEADVVPSSLAQAAIRLPR